MSGAEPETCTPKDAAVDLLSPREFFGFAPGCQGRLADWAGICAYAQAAETACPHIRVLPLGRSTEGRPLIAVAVGAPRGEAPTPGPISDQATVVLICGTHAAEAAGPQGIPDLLHKMATGNDPIAHALRTVFLVVVPALDPDGLDRMCTWLRTAAGRAAAGAPPPGLHRRYAGHDINRDWIVQTQAEIRAVVDGVLHRFRPQVVLDLHEMWPTGPRMFLPPYAPPVDPAADPRVSPRAGELGAAMAARLGSRGLPGVATGVIFDAYSPARCYPHYHGAVRILCETAGAGLASQITLAADRLRPSAGFDPRVASAAQPLPWPGGAWSSQDVQRYQAEAIRACMELVAEHAAEWVQWQAALLAGAADARQRHDAYFIPADQPDPSAVGELRRVLVAGGLEVEEGPGGITVPRAQVFGHWADVLLQPQPYPKLRRRGAGAVTPYDQAAHALAAMMGVRCERRGLQAARAASAGEAHPAPAPTRPQFWSAGDMRTYASVFAAVTAGEAVWRVPPGEEGPEAGGFVAARNLQTMPATWRHRAIALAPPRVAMYASWRPGSDEGWLRYTLDRFEVPYVVLRDEEVQQGAAAHFTHVILPSLRGRDLMHGLPADRYGPKYAGGLGEEGRQQLFGLMTHGGTLVAIEWAAAWAHSAFGLPLRDRTLEPAPPSMGPSAILPIAPATGPLGMGAPARTWVMYRGGPIFLAPPQARAAVFTGEAPIAGIAEGAKSLEGSAAIADVKVEAGRCRLYAFSPYFRAQSWASARWLFNALLD